MGNKSIIKIEEYKTLCYSLIVGPLSFAIPQSYQCVDCLELIDIELELAKQGLIEANLRFAKLSEISRKDLNDAE